MRLGNVGNVWYNDVHQTHVKQQNYVKVAYPPEPNFFFRLPQRKKDSAVARDFQK